MFNTRGGLFETEISQSGVHIQEISWKVHKFQKIRHVSRDQKGIKALYFLK